MKDFQRNKIISLSVIVVGAVIMVFPFLFMLSGALKSDSEFWSRSQNLIPERLAWENFRRGWGVAPFGRYMWNSFFIATCQTTIVASIASLTGFAFAKYVFPGRNFLFLLCLSGLMIPFHARMIPLFLIVRDLGWLNSYKGIIIPGMASPFATFLMRQYMQTIPDELLYAARIDGCSEFGIFWRIILPLIKPAISVVVIFTFMSSWNNFLWPLVVLHSQQLYTIPLGLSRFTWQFFTQHNQLLAVMIITIMPVIVVYTLFQRHFIQGIALTGMKY